VGTMRAERGTGREDRCDSDGHESSCEERGRVDARSKMGCSK